MYLNSKMNNILTSTEILRLIQYLEKDLGIQRIKTKLKVLQTHDRKTSTTRKRKETAIGSVR